MAVDREYNGGADKKKETPTVSCFGQGRGDAGRKDRMEFRNSHLIWDEGVETRVGIHRDLVVAVM